MTAHFERVEKLFPGKPALNCNGKLTSLIYAPRKEMVSGIVLLDWVS